MLFILHLPHDNYSHLLYPDLLVRLCSGGHMCSEPLQSRLTLCDPVAAALQAPASTGFSRKNAGVLPCPPPGGLPDPEI